MQTYIENPNTKVITISFSSDSTCSSIAAYSQTNRAETLPERNEVMHLHRKEISLWHNQNDYCQIPDWMHGNWEYVTINDDEIIYRDHSSFKTYTMKCIQNHLPSIDYTNENRTHLNETRFIAFSRTQCGEEQYHCVWIVKRSLNVMEFQIGAKTVQHIDDNSRPSESICDNSYFDETRWLTQGQMDNALATTTATAACPIDGEFEGLIPDAEGLCAKLWSECDRPDIMYYQVYACDYDEIFEGKIK